MRGKAVIKANRVQSGKNSKGQFDKGNKLGYRFKPGYDPKRNYHGRPKDHDALRELIRDVLSEVGEGPRKEKRSRIYDLLVRMSEGESATDHTTILEHGFGKVPQPIEISKMSDDDLRKFIEEQQRGAGLSPGGSQPQGSVSGGESGTADESGTTGQKPESTG